MYNHNLSKYYGVGKQTKPTRKDRARLWLNVNNDITVTMYEVDQLLYPSKFELCQTL